MQHSTSSTPSKDAFDSTESNTAELSRPSQNNPQIPSSPETSEEKPSDTYERLILDSKPYLCAIPQPPPPSTKNTTAAHNAAADEAAELARATDRGWDLLQEMSGQCLYFVSGWWSYSFCYARSVKQFHQLPPGKGGAPMFPPVEDPSTPTFVLGKFGERKVNSHRVGMGGSTPGGEGEKEAGLGMEDKSGATTQVQAKGTASSRYLSQKLSGGTTCDLTGAPRRVEVQFHCYPQSADRIGWIKEVSTCSYLMVIYTPRLCDDVAFLPPREEKAEPIVCKEVVKATEVKEWEARKLNEMGRKGIGASGDREPDRPMVGGIEVGGMKLVGKEGRRLEVPQMMQPGSHGHNLPPTGGDNAELIAKRDPKEEGGRVQKISDDDIKKMGLDPEVVEAVRRELERADGGKGWRLEAFDGPEGRRALRGMMEGKRGDWKEYAVEEVDEGYMPEAGEGKPLVADEEEGEDGEGRDGDEPEGSEEEYRDEL